jgi:formylglycine-generating enzyme required for sulfatase activity
MIEQLIQALSRAGVTLDYRQLEEALWLAGAWSAARAGDAAESRAADSPTTADATTTGPSDQPPVFPEKPQPPPAGQSEVARAAVYPTITTPASGAAARATRASLPGAPALPDALRISRALRPFSRRTKSRQVFVLDEEATVNRSAESGYTTIVSRPARERWFEVALVVEDSPSMVVWRQTAREFKRLLERHGAFRGVRLWRLRVADGQPRLRDAAGRAHEPQALVEPFARRLVILLTDGVAREWQSGAFAELLTRWAGAMPVAVAQMLGERLWKHTALGEPQARVRAFLPGVANADLAVELPWWSAGETDTPLPAPLINFKPENIEAWARTVMGAGAQCRAVLLAPSAPEDAPAEAASPPAPPEPEERVRRFKALVSPAAYDLAVFFSYTHLTLPVMRLVHAAMIPAPRQEELSEVLLGGLLKRQPPVGEASPPTVRADDVGYEFHDGVRETLQRFALADERERVFESVSHYLEERYGVSNFLALLHGDEGEVELPDGVKPFAAVGRDALKRWGLTRLAKPSASTSAAETVREPQPGTVPDDPWKGVFGGKSESNFRKLTARVTEIPGADASWFSLQLTVSSTDPENHPFSGEVRFFLHHTFAQDKPRVTASGGEARLSQTVWGAFTVGALSDGGRTRLELDLADLSDAPPAFRERAARAYRYACYLSYPHADRREAEFAHEFYAALTKQVRHFLGPQADVFLDQTVFAQSPTLDADRAQSLYYSACAILLLTPAYFAEEVCLREYEALRRLEAERLKLLGEPQEKLILPALLRPVRPLPESLRDRQVIDLRSYVARRPGIRFADPKAQGDVYEIARYVAEQCKRLARRPEAFAGFREFRWPSKDEVQPLEIGPPLVTFEFETVTLDARGRVMARRTDTARSFTEELAAGVGLEMVEIPGGTFTMGAPEGEENSYDDERPPHEVKVSPFFMGKFAVTQEQWRIVAGWPKVERELEPEPSHFKGEKLPLDERGRLPVEQVSWEEATEFCARLSRETGRAYRLPTEAEWEYACRAGTQTPFAFGETITPEFVNYDGNYPYGKAKEGEYRGEPVPVGSLGVANNFGLYDLHGNVWEWCQDWFSKDYYAECQRQGAIVDPQGPPSGTGRVLRGGSWIVYGHNCRSANRNYGLPDNQLLHVGLRVVVSARTS